MPRRHLAEVARVAVLLAAMASLWACRDPGIAAPRAGADAWRAQWATEWNARVDAHGERRDHPCGDFRFDPWAREFLAPCETYTASGEAMTPAECEARNAWAWERSRQCNEWQAWLLRHHHQQERTELPEPETRVFLE